MCQPKIIYCVILTVIVNNAIYSQSSRPNRLDTTIVIQLWDKWNLVSLPVTVMDNRVSSNFPTQYAWAFQNTPGTPTFYKTDTMENSQGYFIKMDGSQSIQITGGIILEDTIDVREGWNLIGSISRPVPDSRLRLVPAGRLSHIFPYRICDPGCYMLEPGWAYWIRAPHPGKLIISAISDDTSYTQSFIDGWNLVSLPVHVDDTRVSANFPAQYVFEYQSNPDNTNYYHRTDSLTNGKGYWMKINGSQSVWMAGKTILEDTIDVHNGWNLIGSISKPVPVSDLRVIPQGEIGISGPCGYWWGSCDTVQPGLAYWAKIVSDSSNLKLIMSAR